MIRDFHRGIIVAAIALAVAVIGGATACDEAGDSPPPFDTGCLFTGGHASLFYNLVVDAQRRGPLVDDPGLWAYLGPDGKPIPYQDSILVENPDHDPRTGNDLVGAAFGNYLRAQDFPTLAFSRAYTDIRDDTGQDGPLDDASIYYVLAQRLEQDGNLPDSAALDRYKENGRLVSPDTSLTVDNPSDVPEVGNGNVVRVFGELYEANGIPARVLVDTYRAKYETCK